jgi:hypothetical protein
MWFFTDMVFTDVVFTHWKQTDALIENNEGKPSDTTHPIMSTAASMNTAMSPAENATK